jgi:hypothetical protein
MTLNVAEVVADPEFALALVCLRRTQTVGADGTARVTWRRIAFTGVITADDGTILDIIAEDTRTTGAITIHTTFALQDADHVAWGGTEYIVDRRYDYSPYGFVRAHCSRQPITHD